MFHPIQWLCLNLFGYKVHKDSVDVLNWFLMRCLNVLGTRFTFTIEGDLPKNVPLVIVSNHQSMWDIPPIIWYLRKRHPAFISKKELGKGIPSISYNLRHGASVLIDRNKPEQATQKIINVGQYAAKNNRSVVIFPEGTRSRDGNPKPFKVRGLKTLFEQIPEGYVLPVSINNSWQLQRYGMFPIPVGVHLKHHAHPAIKISEHTTEALIATVENTISQHIKNE
ncbi:MAG: 1-acyl-sn-glycerol-3-phosphate acyltransferase [Patiriisocius sp.]